MMIANALMQKLNSNKFETGYILSNPNAVDSASQRPTLSTTIGAPKKITNP